MLRETTVASGPWEGFARAPDGSARNYHGYFSDGAPQGWYERAQCTAPLRHPFRR